MEMGETGCVHPSEELDMDVVVDELRQFLHPPTADVSQVRGGGCRTTSWKKPRADIRFCCRSWPKRWSGQSRSKEVVA